MKSYPPIDREADERGRIGFTRVSSYGFPLIILVINSIFAVLLFATFKFGVNAEITFFKSFAVVMYAGLPGILKILLAIGSIWAGASADSFVPQNAVATNPGYFLAPAESPWLYTLASQFDVFAIWTLVLVAVGFSCAGKVKRSTAYVIVFGWFAVATIIFTGLSAAFS